MNMEGSEAPPGGGGGAANFIQWPPKSAVLLDPNSVLTHNGKIPFKGMQPPKAVPRPGMNGQMISGEIQNGMLAQQISNFEENGSISSEDMMRNALMANPMLMNMNIPSANFSRVINFETMPNGGAEGLRRMNGIEAHSYDDDAYSSQLDEQENVADLSIASEMSADLLEQQQAREQSQLLARFKQLRDWQLQQQGLLMAQQQQQLEKLQEEQQKMQMIIAKQRQMQWGANTQNGNPQISQMGNPPLPRKQEIGPPVSSLPAALAQGALSMAKMNQMVTMANMMPHKGAVTMATQNGFGFPPQLDVSQHQMKGGRPVPKLPPRVSTPEELRENGNPQLDSDSNTIETLSNITDEGVHPLPQYEMDSDRVSSKMNPENKGKSQTFFPHYTADSEVGNGYHRQNGMIIHNGSTSHGVHPTESSGKSGNGMPFLHGQLPNGAILNSHKHDSLDFREGNLMRKGIDFDRLRDNEELETEGAFEEEHEHYQEEEELMGEDAEEEYYETEEGEEDEGEEEDRPATFDELPISGIGAQKKTFEELLEEELRKEEERLKNANSTSGGVPSKGSGRKSFLKKGQGLTRYDSASKDSPREGVQKPNIKPANKKSAPEKTSNRITSTPVKAPAPQSTSINNRPKTQKKSPPEKQPVKTNLKLLSTKPTKPSTNSAKTKQGAQTSEHLPPQPGGATLQKTTLRSLDGSTKSLKLPPPPPLTLHKTILRKKGADNVQDGDNSVGDISFQKRMKDKETDELVEADELEEFELLEQYADDNASFLSNVSAVNKVLQNDKKGVYQRTGVVERTLAPKAYKQAASNKKPAENSAQFQKVKSDCIEEQESEDNAKEESEKKSSARHIDERSQETKEQPTQQDTKLMQRKLVTLESRSPRKSEKSPRKSDPSLQHTNSSLAHLSKVLQFSDSEDSDCQVQPETGTMSGQSESRLHNNQLESREQSIKVVSEVKLHTKNDGVTEEEDSQTEESEESSKEESESEEDDQEKEEEEFEFGDEDAWDESAKHSEDEEVKPKPIIIKKPALFKTKVSPEAVSGVNAKTVIDSAPVEVTPPPTSHLVGKLFPKLKQEQIQKQQQRQQQQLEQITAAAQPPPADGAQSKMLRDKLVELESEIERFRTENANLGKLRKERDEGLEQMKKEMAEFETQKNEELKRLQEFKAEEMKKLKKEKKLFEQYQKTMRTMPDKKEREEIQTLKQQVSDLQEEMKRKESRWTASSGRLRDRIEQLETENSELKEEVRLLEKRRLDAWQKKESDPLPNIVTSQKDDGGHQGHQLKSPKPESRPPKMGLRDNNLRLSTNFEFDRDSVQSKETDETLSQISETEEEARGGFGEASRRAPVPAARPGRPPCLATSEVHRPKAPSPRSGEEEGVNRNVPRKRAIPASITDTVDKGNEKYEELQHSDGKVEKIYTNGAREILFANGTRKQISNDGQSIIVSFFNGDMKQIMPDQRVIYYYADAQTTHTTYPDGLEILQFPNQQTEKHYPDGTKEITFPDQTIKYLFPSGIEESIFHDGTVIRVEKNGDKVMEFANGQREIHTQQYKRREYPDGTVKTVYPDGRQETRYSSGRIRVKDKQGQIIVDKRV